jgi:esterase/lipase
MRGRSSVPLPDTTLQQLIEIAVPEKPESELKGVALLIHGLNTGPDALRPIAEELAARGIQSFILKLAGSDCQTRNVSAETWIVQFQESLKFLEDTYPALPKHVVGFSLGALVAVAAFDSSEELAVRPTTLTLLSPALSLQCYTQALQVFTWLRVFGISLPSLAPKSIRACSSTSFQAYHSLFQLYSDTRSLNASEQLAEIPTLLLFRKGDELINRRGLKKWIQRNRLSHWNLQEVHTADPTITPRHALFSAKTIGADGWQELVGYLIPHLGYEAQSK